MIKTESVQKDPWKLDPGKVLQSIDNEEVTVTMGGKRRRIKKSELYIRKLFVWSVRGDLTCAALIASMAETYFGPENEGASEIQFVVVRDEDMRPSEGQARAENNY